MFFSCPPLLVHYWHNTPYITRVLLVLFFVIHLTVWIAPHLPHQVLYYVLFFHRCWEPLPSFTFPSTLLDILFSTFSHADVLHLVCNCIATYIMVSQLEEALGSVGICRLVAVLLILTQASMFLLSQLYINIVKNYFCVLGFSGILFGLLTVDCYGERPERTMSLLGFVDLNARLVPWAALVFTAFIFPSSSLLGHLSGILMGIVTVAVIPRRLFAPQAAVDSIWDRLQLQNFILGPAGGRTDIGWSRIIFPSRPRIRSGDESPEDVYDNDTARPMPAPGAVSRQGFHAFSGTGRRLHSSGSTSRSNSGSGSGLGNGSRSTAERPSAIISG